MVVSIVLALAFVAGQTPPSSGRLSGRVTVEGTNAPIAGARVIVFPAPPRNGPPRNLAFGPPPEALTDDDGRFVFRGLADGEYRIDVQKTGYAPLVAGFGTGLTVHVPSDGLDVHLQRGGVITGRVLSASGEPISDMHLMALRHVDLPGGPGGMPRWIPAPMTGMQQTNDVGEFRIAGLAPGEYIISAMRPMASPFGSAAVAATARTTALATTYYPGTTNQAAAQPIAVRAGDTVANIEFTMQSTPAFRVSGRVVDESNQPVAGAMLMLLGDPRSGMFVGPAGHAQSGADGRFTIADVAPGTYRLQASVPMRMDPQDGAGAAGGIGAVSVGTTSGVNFSSWSVDSRTGAVGGGSAPPTEIVVTDANITGVMLTIRR